MQNKIYISEIFSSFQGEGEYIGYRQVFVRLSGCRFGCPYCDTDYSAKETFDIDGEEHANPVSSGELADLLIEKYGTMRFHSYSFTGGEPLLNTAFVAATASALKEKSNAKLFLETSGLVHIDTVLFDGLFDIISVDIKTHSPEVVANMRSLFANLKSFKKTTWYLKLLLSDDTSESILDAVICNMNEFSIDRLVIQPIDNKISVSKADNVFDKLYASGIVARLIAQSHKLLSIR